MKLRKAMSAVTKVRKGFWMALILVVLGTVSLLVILPTDPVVRFGPYPPFP